MNKQQKLILLAAIAGISAVGLLILLNRRNESEESFDEANGDGPANEEGLEELPDLTAAQTVASASETVVKINVPQYCVGVIIGKGGENIRQLKKETGARLDFEKELDKEERDGNKERILEIKGEREKVLNAEMKIKQLISEIPKVIEDEMLIPEETCGRIIGKGGQNIRELRSITGVKINLEDIGSQVFKGMKKVSLKGTKQQIEYAKGLIAEQVEKAKEFLRNRKMSNRDAKKRSPSPATRPKFPASKIPKTDDFFQVFVSAFDIPGHFYVQLVTKESSILDELTKEMTDYYGNPELSQNEKPPSQIVIGDIYCAPFELDDLWYRANVIEVKEEESAAVLFYIDYGDTGIVPFEDLRKPKPEFLKLEAQAIECFLANVEPKDEKWSEESIERFEELTQCAKWSELMARVVRFQEIDNEELPCLELIDTKQEVDINIAETLIKEGYAVQSKSDKASHESKPLLIEEDAVAEESANNNVIEVTSLGLHSGVQIADEIEIEAMDEGLVSSGNELNKSLLIDENITAESVVFDKNEASFPESGLMPENGSFPKTGSVPRMGSSHDERPSEGVLEELVTGHLEGSSILRRSSVDAASISSGSTEDTVIHVTGKQYKDVRRAGSNEDIHADEKKKKSIESVGGEKAGVKGQEKVQLQEAGLDGQTMNEHGEKTEEKNVDIEPDQGAKSNTALDANDSGVDLDAMNIDPNFKRSVTEEVSLWMERSCEENAPLETIPEDPPVDNGEKGMTPSVASSMVSSNEVEGSDDSVKGEVQWKFQESLEMAKQNPVILSDDDEDSMSYFSARSEQTMASDNDAMSFKSAPETPTNVNEFQFPTKDDSFDYDIITTPVGSDDESLAAPADVTPTGTLLTTAPDGTSTLSSLQKPKYQIKVIDESAGQSSKVVSASMDNVSSVGGSQLSSSPQRISNMSSSMPHFGGLQKSQSQFGGSGSIYGKETSI